MFSRKFEGEGIQSNNDFKVSYEVVVVTSSEASSGTDSCVYLKLVGDGGDSGEFELQQSNHFNKFETGQSDSFVFRSNVALGSVQQVHVRLHPDGNLIKRSWRLDCIKVSGGDLQAPAQFLCGQVLSPENPTAVLVHWKSASEEQAPVSQQFQKADGRCWEPAELERVKSAFQSCSAKYVHDRR
jgi:hypothetical protein